MFPASINLHVNQGVSLTLMTDPLFQGASTSRTSFSQRFLEIKNQCGLSDSAASVMLDVITDILPVPNRCPSWYQINAHVDSKTYFRAIEDKNGVYYILDIQFQMENIIKNNEDIFQRFDATNMSDIMNASIFHDMDTDEVKYVYLIVSADGVSPVMTSKQFHIWPLIASVANLHPYKRGIFRNILFGVLFHGARKPNFEKFLSLLIKLILFHSFGKALLLKQKHSRYAQICLLLLK